MTHLPLATMVLAISTPPATPAPSPLTPSPLTLCEAGEDTVLYGQVEDDFGLDVAVCTSQKEGTQMLTIRWEGEGGGSSVSCTSSTCDGRIEYSRYTSPHLTILTLAWRDGEHTQWLTQTAAREDNGAAATFETQHKWQTPGSEREDALEYRVKTTGEALSLMGLEAILEAKPWHKPLLDHGPKDKAQS